MTWILSTLMSSSEYYPLSWVVLLFALALAALGLFVVYVGLYGLWVHILISQTRR